MKRNRARLTDRLINSTKPTGKLFRIWDVSLRNFGVCFSPRGTPTFFIQYKRPSSTFARVTVCPFVGKNTEDARRLAAEMLRDTTLGADPLEDRRKAKQPKAPPPTVATLWERFHNDGKHRWKPRTAANYADSYRTKIQQPLGGVQLKELTRELIRDWHSRDTARVSVNRALAMLKAMLGFGIEIGWLSSNPAVGVKLHKEKPKERFLSQSETQALLAALDQLESARRFEPEALSCIRLLALTGCRLSEIRDARWDWIHIQEKQLRLPDSKTGRKVVSLSTAAIEELSRLAAVRTTPYVCGNPSTGQPIRELRRPWNAARELAGLGADVTLHTLRHSYASSAIASGVPLATLRSLLGHSSVTTTQRYSHSSPDALNDAAELISQHISRKVPKAEVVALDIEKHQAGRRRKE